MCPPCIAYFAYKLARIYGADSGDRYRSTRATLTVFSIICIALLIATFILMGTCLLNFGKGLRERSASLHLILVARATRD